MANHEFSPLDDFLEEVTRGFGEDSEAVKPQETEEEIRQRNIRYHITAQYFVQYYSGRPIKGVEEEARRFNATFPLWRKIKARNYRATESPDAEEWATVTEGLTHEDGFLVCDMQIESMQVDLTDKMPGTDEARLLDYSIRAWGKVRNIVEYARDAYVNPEGV